MKRILIVGDAGRGKTTLAEALAAKTGLPRHSTDDFFWKTKFTEMADPDVALAGVSEIYPRDEWIVEGSTRRLVAGGLERADVIYVLKFRNIFQQYRALVARHRKRDNERLRDILQLLVYIMRKKLGGSYGGFEKMIEPYAGKVVRLESFGEIDRALENFGNLDHAPASDIE
jgi:adenylate kinase family enzyme